MNDFKEMLNELNINLEELNIYIESDKFKKEAQRKIFLEMNKKKLQRSIKLRAGKD